jgi:hypothetical protein
LHTPLTSDQIDRLRTFNTCVISDAIETFGVRLEAARIAEKKQQVIELSQKPGASYEELGQAVRELLDFQTVHPGSGEHQWKQQ